MGDPRKASDDTTEIAETTFKKGETFDCFAGKTVAGTKATSFFVPSQVHEHGTPDEPQQPSSGIGSGDVQQHFFSATAECVNNREILFLQLQPSHKQTPNGAAVLNITATIATQATHCRNENASINPELYRHVRTESIPFLRNC